MNTNQDDWTRCNQKHNDNNSIPKSYIMLDVWEKLLNSKTHLMVRYLIDLNGLIRFKV